MRRSTSAALALTAVAATAGVCLTSTSNTDYDAAFTALVPREVVDGFGYMVGAPTPTPITHSVIKTDCPPATADACSQMLNSVFGVVIATAVSVLTTFTTN